MLGSLIGWGGWKVAKGAYDYWQKEKENKNGLIGRFAKNAGNYFQDKINNMNDGLLKVGAATLNQTFMNPDSESDKDNAPDTRNGAAKTESFNSPNASYSGGEGLLYGSKPGARNPYDYASTDFESILRKQMNNQRIAQKTPMRRSTKRKARAFGRFD